MPISTIPTLKNCLYVLHPTESNDPTVSSFGPFETEADAADFANQFSPLSLVLPNRSTKLGGIVYRYKFTKPYNITRVIFPSLVKENIMSMH